MACQARRGTIVYLHGIAENRTSGAGIVSDLAHAGLTWWRTIAGRTANRKATCAHMGFSRNMAFIGTGPCRPQPDRAGWTQRRFSSRRAEADS